ncbi:MAG: DUF6790 family protein [Gemmatimonadales bacterium]
MNHQLRRLRPPLAAFPTGGWLERLRFVASIGGLAFFFRWALGGLGFYAAVAALGAWDVTSRRSRDHWANRALLYYVFFICGVGGIWNAIGHSVLARRVAESIGWPPGSPFQLELAAAHGGWALVALASPWAHPEVIAAVVVSKAVFLFGAAAVHLADLALTGNQSPGNAGFAVLYFGDIGVPLATLILWTIGRRRHPSDQ